MQPEVVFPIVAKYLNIDDLVCNLEEFDSQNDGEVWDEFGRAVHLKLHLLQVKELSLVKT